MTQLSELFDPADLTAHVDMGMIKANRHPTLPLTIYTYTRECQYSGWWNDITKQCRGLIVDDYGNVAARPFAKFFNVGEHGTRDYAPALEIEPFDVYEKVDGSLGILFNYCDEWVIASKGSFISEQAQWAQRRVDSDWCLLDALLDANLTYCVEIIYPVNRIVVDYGDREDLVLLAVFRSDGTEVPLRSVKPSWQIGSVVRSWGSRQGPVEFGEILGFCANNIQIDNALYDPIDGTQAEGFVIRFKSGLRVKSKYADYLRLHKLMTGVTERDVWRAVAYDDMMDANVLDPDIAKSLKCSPNEIQAMQAAQGRAFDLLVDGVPDEFDQWVRGVRLRLISEYFQKAQEVYSVYDKAQGMCKEDDKGEFARNLQSLTADKTILSSCFAVYDEKRVSPMIWRSLYPSAMMPFKEADE